MFDIVLNFCFALLVSHVQGSLSALWDIYDLFPFQKFLILIL